MIITPLLSPIIAPSPHPPSSILYPLSPSLSMVVAPSRQHIPSPNPSPHHLYHHHPSAPHPPSSITIIIHGRLLHPPSYITIIIHGHHSIQHIPSPHQQVIYHQSIALSFVIVYNFFLFIPGGPGLLSLFHLLLLFA